MKKLWKKSRFEHLHLYQKVSGLNFQPNYKMFSWRFTINSTVTDQNGGHDGAWPTIKTNITLPIINTAVALLFIKLIVDVKSLSRVWHDRNGGPMMVGTPRNGGLINDVGKSSWNPRGFLWVTLYLDARRFYFVNLKVHVIVQNNKLKRFLFTFLTVLK